MARKPTGNPPGRRTRTEGHVVADHSLRIKLTADEHEALRVNARRAGYDSVSEYVRARCVY
jgi:hypothetical protein